MVLFCVRLWNLSFYVHYIIRTAITPLPFPRVTPRTDQMIVDLSKFIIFIVWFAGIISGKLSFRNDYIKKKVHVCSTFVIFIIGSYLYSNTIVIGHFLRQGQNILDCITVN